MKEEAHHFRDGRRSQRDDSTLKPDEKTRFLV